MLKQLVSALTAVCCLASSAAMIQAAQNDAETAKFYYTQNGETLNISLNGSINKESRAADAVLAVYDGDVLISTTIVHMDEDIESLSMGDFTITLPYAPEAPSVKSFLWASDGSCEPLGNVSQLSGIPGNAVEWYGWVTATSRTNLGLDNDEVSFTVLNSPDMDISSSVQLTAKTGNTDIDDRLFEYVKASVILDDDTDEYTILDYETLSNEQTVSFPASALISYELNGEAAQEPSKSLTVGIDDGTAHYSLADDTEIYVNGVSLWLATEELAESYILDNPTGTVKLVDTADADGKTDGIFDFIMVSYYVDGTVDSVSLSTSNTQTRIYFRNNDALINRARLEWDPSDEDVHVSFTDTNGETVDPLTITEYDVLSIAYDVSSDFANSFFYDVIVSRNVVHGAVSAVDLRANTVTVNGTAYPVARMITAEELTIGEEYTFFIDAFGYIAHYEEGSVTPPTPPEPEIPSNEFSFNSAGSTIYISSANGVYTIEGVLRLDTSGEPKPLTAEIELSQGGSALGSKSIAIPAGSDRLDLGGSALECSGTPDSAVLYIKDGDNILYTKELALTSSSDIYTVHGRITGTFKNDAALGYDEVAFLIENAEDFDGSGPIKYDTKPITANSIIGGSDDMLFIYSEAEIAKNEDGSYTIISIMSLNDKQTLTFPSMLFDSLSYHDYNGSTSINVYENEYSSSTIQYRLAQDAQMYVNGVCVGDIGSNERYFDPFYSNAITLIDVTETGSTANDGYYDYIFVSHISDCGVESISQSGDTVTIVTTTQFNSNETGYYNFSFSFDISETYLRITHEGNEIGLEDLQKHDILSIEHDVTDGLDMQNSSFYDITVSRDTVTGSLTSINEQDLTISVDGTEYRASNAIAFEELDLAAEYCFYLNCYGEIADYEEIGSPYHYGLIIAMYNKAGSVYPVAKVINENGEIFEYECKDREEADNVYYAATGEYQWTDFYEVPASTAYNRLSNGYGLFAYTVTGNNIHYVDTDFGRGGAELDYRSDVQKMGGYSLNEHTKLICITDYLKGSSPVVYPITIDDLTDDELYDAFFYDRNSRQNFRFGFIFGGNVDLPDYDPASDPSYAEDEIGVITAMYMRAGDILPTVRLINSAGNIIEYTCKTQEDAESFYLSATGETLNGELSSEVTLSDINDRILSGDAICTYSSAQERISFGATGIANGGAAIPFNGTMLGDTDISAVPILYLGEYINDNGMPYVLEASALTGSEYAAYTVSDGDGNVKLAIIISGDAALPGYDPGSDPTYISEKTGVISAIFMKPGKAYPTVRLLTSDGETVEYECASLEESNNFYNCAAGTTEGYPGSGELTKAEIVANGIQNAVVNYSVENNKVYMLDKLDASGGDLVYDSASASLGGYKLDESSIILVLDGFINKGGSSAAAIKPNMLADSCTYNAYAFDIDPDTSVCGFVIITSGVNNITADTPIAIVTADPIRTVVDGAYYTSIPVLRNGEETTVLYDGDETFRKGEIILYETNNDATTDLIYTVMRSISDYSYFRSEAIESFSEMIDDSVIQDGEGNLWAWQSENKEVKAYFGPIYKKDAKSLSIITNTEIVDIDGSEYLASDIYDRDQVADFNLSTCRQSYSYDYSYRLGDPKRISSGALNYSSYSIYGSCRVPYIDSEYILWDGYGDTYETVLSVDARPNFAFVKTINGDATEVVYFIAD